MTLNMLACRHEDTAGLVLLDMMRMGGTRQVAELGATLMDAGAVVLACSAARALLRWERAQGWPVGMAVLEVIRCAVSSYNECAHIDEALRRAAVKAHGVWGQSCWYARQHAFQLCSGQVHD